MMWFTADEHYHHANIIDYCDRPFDNATEMDAAIIRNNNAIVKKRDTVYHLGDFIMGDQVDAQKIIDQLNGFHIFIKGSHDTWLSNAGPRLMEIHVCNEKIIPGTRMPNVVVLCHYAMRMWSRSHYGSMQLFGHSHGRLRPVGRQMDVGVDCHSYRPVSLDAVITELSKIPVYDAELECDGEKERV